MWRVGEVGEIRRRRTGKVTRKEKKESRACEGKLGYGVGEVSGNGEVGKVIRVEVVDENG